MVLFGEGGGLQAWFWERSENWRAPENMCLLQTQGDLVRHVQDSEQKEATVGAKSLTGKDERGFVSVATGKERSHQSCLQIP